MGEDAEDIDLEKSNIFSLGLTFLQVACLLTHEEIKNMNSRTKGQKLIQNALSYVESDRIKNILNLMLEFDVNKRISVE